jgi:hypothetical protein
LNQYTRLRSAQVPRAPRAPDPPTVLGGAPDIVAVAIRDLAAQDWLVASYLVVLLGASVLGAGPRRAHAVACVSADFAIFAVTVLLVRARLLPPVIAGILYRGAIVFAILASFLQLQWVLPAATTHLVDADLHALDLALFGVEPSLALDAWVTPARTEWFAAFYFGYFPFLLAWVAPAMALIRDRRLLAELSFGIVWVFCIGQALYLLVPGHGPYVQLASAFTHPLEGPTFWPLVRQSVDAVELSARTDIFPSLHTAAPTFFTTFAFLHRDRRLFRALVLPCAFFASQVVVATMYLRWHWGIDVLAGLAHGVSAALVARTVAREEDALRVRLTCAPVWTTPWLRGDGQPRFFRWK